MLKWLHIKILLISYNGGTTRPYSPMFLMLLTLSWVTFYVWSVASGPGRPRSSIHLFFKPGGEDLQQASSAMSANFLPVWTTQKHIYSIKQFYRIQCTLETSTTKIIFYYIYAAYIIHVLWRHHSSVNILQKKECFKIKCLKHHEKVKKFSTYNVHFSFTKIPI